MSVKLITSDAAWCGNAHARARQLSPPHGATCSPLGALVRALLDAKVRREGARGEALMAALRGAADRLANELRRPPDRSRRYALFPLVAGIAEPA